MNFHLDGFEDIQEKLLDLEKQKRRFKKCRAAALIIAASIFFDGPSGPEKECGSKRVSSQGWRWKGAGTVTCPQTSDRWRDLILAAAKTGEWHTLVDDFRTFPIGPMVSEIPQFYEVA